MVRRPQKKLFVEGGGDNDALKTQCRRGFRKFLERAGLAGRMPRIVACGNRRHAYEQFSIAVGNAARGDVFVLLVDSEGPVAAPAARAEPWKHVATRQGDGWSKPPGATDDDLHFMVECMESWFVADRQALRGFFGQGFNAAALPANPQVENIPKAAVLNGLKNSSRGSSKGPYAKGAHSFQILALVDPTNVRAAASYAARLLAHLNTVL